MSRQSVDAGTWTEITTTSVDTLFSVESGNMRLQTGDTTGVDTEDGHLLRPGDALVVPAGLTVSAASQSYSAVLQYIDLGV